MFLNKDPHCNIWCDKLSKLAPNCYWKIEVGNERSIKIAFMDFDLEYDISCDDDKLKVKGGRNFSTL